MLFIGGPAHEQSINIPWDAEYWDIPVQEEQTPLIPFDKNPLPLVSYKIISYHKRDFVFKGQRYLFMVLDGMTDEEAIQLLNRR